MRNYLLVFALILGLFATGQNQELNCNLVVESKLTGNENVQVFRTLERQLGEFVNNTKWTQKNYSPEERIECSMVIIINTYSGDQFNGSIQISASRPVFNSTYSTPIYNFNDTDFNFRYVEFQNLNYSAEQFQSNLISVLTFHIYMILGLDADTFEPNGGDPYFQQARTIVGYSQQNNASGWEPPRGGSRTRSALIDNVLSPTYKEFRSVMYDYHRRGLDIMNTDVKSGKEAIAETLMQFEVMNRRRPNSFVLRVFFDAKSEEIEDIFTGGPSVDIVDMVDTLQKIAPMHSAKWRNITY